MRLLLDTHTLLWAAQSNPRLSSTAVTLILDPANEKYVSPATFWEIAIKIGKGKYVLGEDFETFMNREIVGNGFQIYPITIAHSARLLSLPYHHRDPFDRMLAAQSLTDGLPLVSSDAIFDQYSVTRLW